MVATVIWEGSQRRLEKDDSRRLDAGDESDFRYQCEFHIGPIDFIEQRNQAHKTDLTDNIKVTSYYMSYIFINALGISELLSRILAAAGSVDYLVFACLAYFVIERYGRRKVNTFLQYQSYIS